MFLIERGSGSPAGGRNTVKIKINKNLKHKIKESDIRQLIETTRPRKLAIGKQLVIEMGLRIRIVKRQDSDTWVVMTHEDYNNYYKYSK